MLVLYLMVFGDQDHKHFSSSGIDNIISVFSSTSRCLAAMMLPFIALAGALASVCASEKNRKLGSYQLRRGDDITEALLKNAVPFKPRRLDGAGEANEMDGSYSISFGKCIDIKTKSEDLFNGNFIDQVQNGNALSLKSYVLFYTCQDANGYGCSEVNSSVYMVDLPTYLSVVGTKEVYQRNNYCEQCENNLEFW